MIKLISYCQANLDPSFVETEDSSSSSIKFENALLAPGALVVQNSAPKTTRYISLLFNLRREDLNHHAGCSICSAVEYH